MNWKILVNYLNIKEIWVIQTDILKESDISSHTVNQTFINTKFWIKIWITEIQDTVTLIWTFEGQFKTVQQNA